MRWRGHRILKLAACLVMLLPMVTAATGCSGDGGGGWLAEILTKLPRASDYYFFLDVDRCREDDDLEDFWGIFEAAGLGYETLGFPLDDADYLGGNEHNVVVLDGTFHLDDVREAAEELGYDKGEYLGVELWSYPGFGLALRSDRCIITGSETDVEKCIEVIRGERRSAGDNDEIMDDMVRLPGRLRDGLLTTWTSDPDTSDAFTTWAPDCSGLETAAMTVCKKDAEKVRVSWVLRFEDDAAAKAAVDDFEAAWLEGESDSNTPTTVRRGQYLELSTDVATKEFSLPSGEAALL